MVNGDGGEECVFLGGGKERMWSGVKCVEGVKGEGARAWWYDPCM